MAGKTIAQLAVGDRAELVASFVTLSGDRNPLCC